MRVISGSAKGVQLQAVASSGTRPISDRVKSGLFGILSNRIAGASILDLFAGTGSVGIEALSRGATRAVFVERDAKAVATIHENLRRTKLAARARVVRADTFRFLAGPCTMFDLVYVAPPQYQGLWHQALTALDSRTGWISPEGLVVVQIFPKELVPVDLGCLRLIDQRRYGSTLLCFFGPAPAAVAA